jgi:hypothetical protein
MIPGKKGPEKDIADRSLPFRMAYDSRNHSNVTPGDVHDIAPGTSMDIFHEDRARAELVSGPNPVYSHNFSFASNSF